MTKTSKSGSATDSSVLGNITSSGNVDEYSLTLIAGFSYQFDALGQGTGSGTLVTPTLTLFSSNGNYVSANSYTTPTVGGSRDTITPTTTGSYLLDVSGSGTGTYTLVSAPQDDYSSLLSTTTSLSIGSSVSGALQTVADTDDFSLNLVAGYSYQFDVMGQGTGSGTLVGPTLTLSTSSGNYVSANSYTTPTLGDSRDTITPTSTGAYVLSISGSGTGTYTVVSAPQDDFSNLTTTTASLSIGSLVNGALQTVSDSDTFAVNLVAGTTYQFDVLGQGTGSGTAVTPTLTLSSSSGSYLSSNHYTIPSVGDSRDTITPTASATYLVTVGGTGTGSYLLVTPNAQTTTNNSDGTSYRYTYTPTTSVLKTVAKFSATNAGGTLISTVVNNNDSTSLVYAYNLSSTVTQTTSTYSGTSLTDGSPSGTQISAVVNNTDGTTLVYAYNPSSTVTQTATKYSTTNTATGAPTGSQISAVVNNTDGTSLVYAYNPSSTVTQTAQRWSATNPANGAPAGSMISDVLVNTNGTSIVYAYNPTTSVTQTATYFSSSNSSTGAPAGTQTSETFDYTNGESAITIFHTNAASTTQYYTGADGTGSLIPTPAPITLAGNTVSVSAGLNASSLSFVGTPNVVTLGVGANTVNGTLSPSLGVSEIGNFLYGLDTLNLSLAGAATSVVSVADTTVSGQHGVSIYSSADPTHGVVLTGLNSAMTAADLQANHLTFANGFAIVS